MTLESKGNLSGRFLQGSVSNANLGDLAAGSCLGGRGDELRGRSVLVATKDQLTAALALIELDGTARRLILCPSDLQTQHLPFVIELSEADAIVSDGGIAWLPDDASTPAFDCTSQISACATDRTPTFQTEWILLTSGTTGRPKLVAHTLASLAGAIKGPSAPGTVWSTFYDIRRYGGLQIFLRTVFAGGSIVLSDSEEPPAAFLERAGAHGVTHILGTPSHWRRALMSEAAKRISPQYVRLSGEIVDQAILNHLKDCYPQARIAHAFASTEAGVVFEVNDGSAGFPSAVIGKSAAGVEVKIEDGSLRIRSGRNASRYLGNEHILKDAEGFVDTRDMVELLGDRYYFAGRRDGVINVGGFKVHPEEVEAVINRHPRVRMSLVHKKKSPIMGSLVVADIVLDQFSEAGASQVEEVKRELLQLCRNDLAPYKVPASMNFVPMLSVAATGKMARHDA